jgi:hypothetical protein
MSQEPTQKCAASLRGVDCEYSRSLITILRQHRLSLLITTYQAGLVVVVGTREGSSDLVLSWRKLTRPMGAAMRPDSAILAVATDTLMWQFRNAPQFAVLVDPTAGHDACFLPGHAFYTGPIDAPLATHAGRRALAP